MLHFFKLVFLLINLNQETILNWFEIENSIDSEFDKNLVNQINFLTPNYNSSTKISVETFRLIIQNLWEKIQDGLTLSDIETILFFILFIRFIILALRYNLKTSFYITCIGIFAGYLWYRHLIDLVFMYRSILLKLPFLNRLGIDAIQLDDFNRQIVLENVQLGENVHWYNPGQVLYYALTKGFINVDTETGFRYYIDPISMAISNLDEPDKSKILPIYYKIYNKIIPKIYDICSKFWSQLSGIAAYAVITRIGKRYCPYLVRWHWTCLLIIGMIEPVFTYLVYRIDYFQAYILIPQIDQANQLGINDSSINIITQVNSLNFIAAFIIINHIGVVLFGLFHAIWGQYFYFPFVVENTELHIGLRPKNSVYSGGKTSWQDKEEKAKNFKTRYPKIWYGWFGHGSDNQFNFFTNLKLLIPKKSRRQLRKFFKRLQKRLNRDKK